MYYFAVTVLIFQLFGKIKSEELCPNVKVELKGFPHLEVVEYTINPIYSEEKMPLPMMENELYITLSSAKLGDVYNWWGLNLIKKVLVEKYIWERTFTLPMYVYNKEKPPKNYEFLNNDFTCLNQPIVKQYALVSDENFPFLMNQYGCNDKRYNDNMDNNVIFLILFNNGIQFNLKNINDKLSGFTKMLGILKVINISNKKNTDDENEIVFKNYLENCQTISSNHDPIIGTNVKIYINEHNSTLVNHDTSAKFNYLIPLMFVLLLCGIFIVKFINHWMFGPNTSN